MANLYRLSRTLLSFFMAQALNMAIPGGPKFERLGCEIDTFDED